MKAKHRSFPRCSPMSPMFSTWMNISRILTWLDLNDYYRGSNWLFWRVLISLITWYSEIFTVRNNITRMKLRAHGNMLTCSLQPSRLPGQIWSSCMLENPNIYIYIFVCRHGQLMLFIRQVSLNRRSLSVFTNFTVSFFFQTTV